jgi:hypothetical protein
VIVSHCEDWSKLLRTLTATAKDPPVLTLSPRDENDGAPHDAVLKKTQRNLKQEELFPGGRNFK